MTSKIIVTGPGKCGTSYFMKLLSELEFDTGFDAKDSSVIAGYEGEKRYHGFEWTIRGKHAEKKDMPYIIKDPYLCLDLPERAKKWDWDIEHVYVLLRDYKDIANHHWRFSGSKQEDLNEEKFMEEYETKAAVFVGSIVQTVVREKIPHTFLRFPRMVTDPLYLWGDCPLLKDNIPYGTFRDAFEKVADVNNVHWGLGKEWK